MLQYDVLAVAFFSAPMPEKSSGLFGSLVGGDLLHSPMLENSGPLSQARGGILILLSSPEIYSKESIPTAFVARRDGTKTLFLLGS